MSASHVETIGLGLSLTFLAAVWPPFNIYIADAISRKEGLTLGLLLVAAFVGLALSTGLVAAGASVTGLPLDKLGGAFVVFTGVRMLLKKPVEDSAGTTTEQRKTNLENVVATFFLALTPGVYAVTAANGIIHHDLFKTAIVWISGPLGVFTGGVLLAYGIRFVRLSIDMVGGIIVVFIGLLMLLPQGLHPALRFPLAALLPVATYVAAQQFISRSRNAESPTTPS